MSAADLLAVLVARHLRYNWDQPNDEFNDHLIFSKGHVSPLLYSIHKAVGVVDDKELMTGYRRFGYRLQGHFHADPAMGRHRHRLLGPRLA
jgi:transketolase